jgi:hypothetical protein
MSRSSGAGRNMASSFLDELVAFRKVLDGRLAEASEAQTAHWKNRLAYEILDRWEVAGDCEKIWRKLGPKLKCPASVFISQIIFAGYNAQELTLRLKRWPELRAKTEERAKRLLRDHDFEHLADISTLSAGFMRARNSYSREVATAARQAFITDLSAAIIARCGKPFDWNRAGPDCLWRRRLERNGSQKPEHSTSKIALECSA